MQTIAYFYFNSKHNTDKTFFVRLDFELAYYDTLVQPLHYGEFSV